MLATKIKMMKKILSIAFLLFVSKSLFGQESTDLNLEINGAEVDTLSFHIAGSGWHKQQNPKGLLDFVYRRTPTTNEYNLLWWSNWFKGGGGIIERPNGQPVIKYFGGFINPKIKKFGELVIGGHWIDNGIRQLYEAKVEFRYKNGLGGTLGMVDNGKDQPQMRYVRLNYRSQINKEWKYTASILMQQVDKNNHLGAYGVIYNSGIMLGGGYDGEEWRGGVGLIASPKMKYIRPAFEGFYINRDPGQIAGSDFLLASFTLKFAGGFLGHPARIGRFLGGTGTEYTNPVITIAPSWNRILYSWEQGNMVDVRFIRTQTPTGTYNAYLEYMVFPFHFGRKLDIFDCLFVGGSYTQTNTTDWHGAMLGWRYFLGSMGVILQSEYDLKNEFLYLRLGANYMF